MSDIDLDMIERAADGDTNACDDLCQRREQMAAMCIEFLNMRETIQNIHGIMWAYYEGNIDWDEVMLHVEIATEQDRPSGFEIREFIEQVRMDALDGIERPDDAAKYLEQIRKATDRAIEHLGGPSHYYLRNGFLANHD